jgi:hypothetical protein
MWATSWCGPFGDLSRPHGSPVYGHGGGTRLASITGRDRARSTTVPALSLALVSQRGVDTGMVHRPPRSGWLLIAMVTASVSLTSACGGSSTPAHVVVATNDTGATVTIAECKQQPLRATLDCTSDSQHVLAPGKSVSLPRPSAQPGSLALKLRAFSRGEPAKCSLVPSAVGPSRLPASVSQMTAAQCR